VAGETTVVTNAMEESGTDWAKVGRPYKQGEALESVIEREMGRLKLAMDKMIVAQDIELEEKALVARGKKK